jgi:hypothetical protein
MCCLFTTTFAQQKSARDYFEEAKQAGALPSLPYVCFRTTTVTSQNYKEESYNDPTFAMLGTSQQIADIIKSKSNTRMTMLLQKFLNSDFLYMQGFDHGIAGEHSIFNRKDPNDPSRADWVSEGTVGDAKTPLIWTFNINWGTLRFRETLTAGSDSNTYTITYYGRCELVDK